MKKKTINAVITKKINEWVDSIEDQEVKKLVQKNTIVTGGCIASMFLKEKVNDYDVYFRNLRTTLAVANYYAEQMDSGDVLTQIVTFGDSGWKDYSKKIGGTKYEDLNMDLIVPKIDEDIHYRVRCFIGSSGVSENQEDLDNLPPALEVEETGVAEETERKKKYRPIFVTSNAITLTDDIQIVIRFYGDPDVIHSNYDYAHTTNYWTSWDKKVVTNQRALESLLAKELVYIGSRYPLASLLRMRKFINRQWTCNAGQILKMVYNLNSMDLNNFYVLEEQLTGVDVHYFGKILEAVKNRKQETGDDALDGAYFMKIIEKIFDDNDYTEKEENEDV